MSIPLDTASLLQKMLHREVVELEEDGMTGLLLLPPPVEADIAI